MEFFLLYNQWQHKLITLLDYALIQRRSGLNFCQPMADYSCSDQSDCQLDNSFILIRLLGNSVMAPSITIQQFYNSLLNPKYFIFIIIMLFRNLNKISYRHFYRFSSEKANDQINQLRWTLNQSGAKVYFDTPHQSSTVFQVVPKMNFNNFIFVNGIDEKEVAYPPGINGQSQVYKFLFDLETEHIIQFNKNGKKIILKSKSCQTDSKDLIKVIRDKGGIYQQLKVFKQSNNPQSFNEISDYLTRYYLKLQTQYYCKKNKISLQSKMTPQLKQKILNFLSEKNEINCQQDIYRNKGQLQRILISIQQTDSKIYKIMQFFQSKTRWYKNTAIIITFVHLVGFAYMIFFVDWLGWDIIEPLTYTVGVLYTLLGIRFYRKYGVNRSQQSIRDSLFKMIMNPTKKAELKQLTSRKQIQMQQYKKILQEGKILKNKLSYNTCMVQTLDFERIRSDV